MAQEIKNMQQLLDRIAKESAGTSDPVRLQAVVAAVGTRSFGPLLLLPGLILFSPMSGIPGIPTTMGLFILLIAIQLLFRKSRFWLPNLLTHRKIPRKKLDRSLKWLRKPAKIIDRVLKPRLTFLVKGVGVDVVAVICLIMALTMPIMELVPFSASSVGLVFSIFGLSLTMHDGLLALIAFLLTIATYTWISMQLL